jgi:DNA repair exonuclease SbcCD ATPase subunit
MLLLENLTIAEAQQEIGTVHDSICICIGDLDYALLAAGVLRAKLLRRDELIESLSAKKARVETTGAGVDTDEGFTLQQLQDSITEYESRFAEDEMEIHRLKGKLVFEREKVVARLSNYESQVILLEERIKKKDKEREAVDKTVEDRDAVIDEMGSEVGRLRKTIDRMEREKSCMQEQMDEAADASEELVQRIAHLEGEVAAKAGVVSDMCAARDAQLQSSGVLSLQLGDQKARYARLVAELDKLVASGSFTYSNVRREVDSSLTGGRSSRAMGGSASRRGSRASRIKLGSSARLGASTVKLASSAQLELPQSQRRPDKEVEGREAPAPTGSTASPTPQRSKAPTKPVDESAITEMLKAANEMEASAVAAAAEAIDELDKCRGELASLRDEVEASGKVYRAREANLKRQRDEATQMLNDAQNKVRTAMYHMLFVLSERVLLCSAGAGARAHGRSRPAAADIRSASCSYLSYAAQDAPPDSGAHPPPCHPSRR